MDRSAPWMVLALCALAPAWTAPQVRVARLPACPPARLPAVWRSSARRASCSSLTAIARSSTGLRRP